MNLLDKAEFTNALGDNVVITLFQDGAGGFHIITGIKRVRKTEEPRFYAGKSAPIRVKTYTEETVLAQTEIEYQALNQFRLERVMNADPDYTMAQFTVWQKENTPQEEEN